MSTVWGDEGADGRVVVLEAFDVGATRGDFGQLLVFDSAAVTATVLPARSAAPFTVTFFGPNTAEELANTQR